MGFTPEELGREAYSAYRVKSNAVSLVTGSPLPMWNDLPGNVKDAWIYSAQAVVKMVNDGT